jgi:hypothetical protein
MTTIAVVKLRVWIITLWLWSASELHRLSDRHLSAKLVSTFADRGIGTTNLPGPRGPRLIGKKRKSVKGETLQITYRTKKLNFVALVRERTIPTERPPLVGEVSVNLWG